MRRDDFPSPIAPGDDRKGESPPDEIGPIPFDIQTGLIPAVAAMLQWLRRRRQAERLAQADAKVLVRDHGAEAYREARERERDVILPDGTTHAGRTPAHWRRVALIVAKRTGHKFEQDTLGRRRPNDRMGDRHSSTRRAPSRASADRDASRAASAQLAAAICAKSYSRQLFRI